MSDYVNCRHCNGMGFIDGIGDKCDACDGIGKVGRRFTEPESSATAPEAPLSAGAVPELPVVAWRRFSHASGWHFWGNEDELGSSLPEDLTPHAPAQATIHAQAAEIERLKRERDEALISKDEFASNWLNCRNREVALETKLAALKAKQVAEVDEVLRLAQAYAQASSDLDESIRSRSRAPRMVNRHDLRVHVAFKAAHEALRAFLTKDAHD